MDKTQCHCADNCFFEGNTGVFSLAYVRSHRDCGYSYFQLDTASPGGFRNADSAAVFLFYFTWSERKFPCDFASNYFLDPHWMDVSHHFKTQ
jgi:hypothetical protein